MLLTRKRYLFSVVVLSVTRLTLSRLVWINSKVSEQPNGSSFLLAFARSPTQKKDTTNLLHSRTVSLFLSLSGVVDSFPTVLTSTFVVVLLVSGVFGGGYNQADRR